MVNLTYTPAWKKFEKDLKNPDVDKSLKAAEAFEGTRAEEMRKDSQARRWETSRKESLAKLKPQWVKDRIKKEKPVDPLIKFKQFGEFNYNLRPVKGYLLLETPQKAQETTATGIIVQREDHIDNFAKVACLGEGDYPCKVGDLILYKRGAGVELKLKGKDCRLIQDTDVLGVFYD